MSFCDMDADQLHTSVWKDFLSRSVFLPQTETESLQTVMNQLDELSEIFNYFKQSYVSILLTKHTVNKFLCKRS